MTASLISWYWNFNLLLALGFVLWRGVKLLMRWPWLRLGGNAQLRWARRVFAGVGLAAFIVALAPLWLPLTPWALSLKAGFSDEWTTVAALPTTALLQNEAATFQWLMVALAAGWAWQLTQLIRQWRRLKSLVAESDTWKKTPNVHLVVSSATNIPFATRALGKYLVVLPARMLSSPMHWRLATQHELQHARNGDLDWLLWLEAAHVLCFWNPFVHAWQREFEVLQELACDEALILQRRVDAEAYGNCLLEVAQYQAAPALGASSMAPLLRRFRNNNTLLRRRIMQLANASKERNSYGKSALLAALIAGGLGGGSLLIAADAPMAGPELPQATLLPLVRINPEYPADALAQDAEGWVQMQFSVDDEGRVYDARVMESCAGPQGERCILNVPLFADAALEALKGWRYQSMADNSTSPRTNLQTVFRFQLEDD